MMAPMDLLQGMRAVLEVSRAGSFAGAARAMNLSAPSVTRIISELEADLGVRLFNRSTRQVALTAEGQSFLGRSEAVLEEVEAIRGTTKAQHIKPSGRLVVSSSLAFGNEMLAPILHRFMKAHPDVAVSLTMSSRTVDLIEDQVDVALRVGVGGLPDSSLTSVKICPYRMVFVATPAHLQRYGTPETLAEISDRPMVKLATGNWGHVQRVLTPQGEVDFRLPDNLSVDSYRAQLVATLNGDTCALLHEFVARPHIADGSLVRVLPGYETVEQAIYGLFAHRTLVAARIRFFLDFLKENFG
jgi:DNA-binding transcriptional LysR family regulator